MKTKKSDKIEETVSPKTVVAAKPLRKSASVAAPKPVVKEVIAAPAGAVKAIKVAKESKSVKEVRVAKKPKLKVVRDSFTMPQSEYQKIAQIKELCLKAGLPVKKSEVLRAGLQALSAMDAAQMMNTLNGLDKIKTGRPNKH